MHPSTPEYSAVAQIPGRSHSSIQFRRRMTNWQPTLSPTSPDWPKTAQACHGLGIFANTGAGQHKTGKHEVIPRPDIDGHSTMPRSHSHSRSNHDDNSTGSFGLMVGSIIPVLVLGCHAFGACRAAPSVVRTCPGGLSVSEPADVRCQMLGPAGWWIAVWLAGC